MGWKAVELQVALPRTQDVGKLQEQLQQRAQETQDRLADAQKKKEEEMRLQVTKQEETEQSRFFEQESSPKEQQKRKQHKKKNEQEKVPHPYKGKTIDITG